MSCIHIMTCYEIKEMIVPHYTCVPFEGYAAYRSKSVQYNENSPVRMPASGM